MIKELVERNRSYRRFDGDYKISKEDLLDLVDLARISSCGANKQVLRYGIYWEQEDLDKIFSHLKWAGSLKEGGTPVEGERPTGYILIYKVGEAKGMSEMDCGIAATNILLRATEKGLGGCMFKSFGKLGEDYFFENHELLLVIALGKPVEKVVLEDMENDSTKYYRDENRVHHVPKRKLEEVLLNI